MNFMIKLYRFIKLQIFKLSILKNRNNNSEGRPLLVAVIIAIMAIGCTGPGDLGMELLPTTDLISVRSLVDYNISAYTIAEDSLRTDEPSVSLIGSMVDPVFGKTTIDLASQFRISYNPDFESDAVADSLFLYLYYKGLYGDTLTPQRFKIYELNSSIDFDRKYYQDENLSSYAKNDQLADFEFIPKRTVTRDSIYGTLDTLYQVLKIPIDMSLAQKLISADSSQMADQEVFLQYFKGLYISVDDVAEKGSILSLELIANADINGSALLLHYHQTNSETGIVDTLSNAYLSSKFSARINSFKHDYSGSPIKNIINNEKQASSQVFIQSTGGLRSKLFIPGLDAWKDSVNVAINKAELVFHVDSVASNPTFYIPPKQLLLTIIDSAETEYLPLDYSFSPSFYGGLLDTTDYTYRFNITQHMQEVVNGKFTNNGFYLSAINKSSIFSRVILKGGGETEGIELKIAYSKVLQ
jgi:hypothetical protein